MRCEDVSERFVDLLYNETGTPPASSELRAHVDSCPSCRSELEELQSVRQSLQSWKSESPPASIAPLFRLLQRQRKPKYPGWLRYGAVAAALVLGLFAVANAEVTWNRNGFSFRSHLLSRPANDYYTKQEVVTLVKRALDDSEARNIEGTMVMMQRLLETIDQERRHEMQMINNRITRTRNN